MMTTCRLLCALLVLALCCCPSVCVTEGSPSLSPAQSQGAGGLGAKNTSATSISTVPADALPSKSPGTGTVEIPGNGAEQPDGTSGLQGAGDAANRNGQELSTAASTSDSAEPTEKVQEPGTGVPGPGGTGPLKQSSTGQAQSGNPTSQASSAGTGVRGSPDTPSPGPIPKQEQAPGLGTDGSGSSGGSVNPNTSSSSVTGTVSAQSQKEHAPTTTTTTTTTKAPTTTTTTTTEAPTTTTTRAPSRLREIDGSLSSSAWVCAPLLLAVSALAYTTLG
ncbi:putative mucin TcMUCII [Trypanosoma cruzi]|nr:putative mucin TcMUCII [Trypanosoma cruzi]